MAARKKTDWADFTQEAAAVLRNHVCGVETLLNEHVPPSEREAVVSALANPGLASTSINRALKKRLGDNVPSSWTLGRHRRGECTCYKGDKR